MKKFLLITLVLTLTFCFAACGEEAKTENNLSYEQGSDNLNTNSDSVSDTQEPISQTPIINTSTCVGCGRECETGKSYCSSCGCWETGCNLQRKGISVYCVNHSCLLCDSKRDGNSPYCNSHRCNNCENVVVDGSQYCVAHKCQLCNNQIFGNSPYCHMHD